MHAFSTYNMHMVLNVDLTSRGGRGHIFNRPDAYNSMRTSMPRLARITCIDCSSRPSRATSFAAFSLTGLSRATRATTTPTPKRYNHQAQQNEPTAKQVRRGTARPGEFDATAYPSAQHLRSSTRCTNAPRVRISEASSLALCCWEAERKS